MDIEDIEVCESCKDQFDVSEIHDVKMCLPCIEDMYTMRDEIQRLRDQVEELTLANQLLADISK